MMYTYSRNKLNVKLGKLQDEITSSDIVTALSSLTYKLKQVVSVFTDQLSMNDLAALNQLIDDHTPTIDYVPTVVASIGITSQEVKIRSVNDFEEVGGVAMSPSDIITDSPDMVIGMATGVFKTNGMGAEIQLYVEKDNIKVPLGIPTPLMNSSGLWVPFKINAPVVDTDGFYPYTLSCRRGDVEDFWVKYCVLSLVTISLE